jgi:hypothetical protein
LYTLRPFPEHVSPFFPFGQGGGGLVGEGVHGSELQTSVSLL